MKKATMILILSTILVVSLTCTQAFCKNETPDAYGPAPNSGDGEPDGSGHDPNELPNQDIRQGPAPNSGDGIPDGSGF